MRSLFLVALLIGASAGIKLRALQTGATDPMPVVSGEAAKPVDVPATGADAPA